MAKVFTELPFYYSEELTGMLVDACFNWFSGPDEKVALKMYTMDTLYKASEKYPELKRELATIFEYEAPRSSPAFKARARKMRNKLHLELE